MKFSVITPTCNRAYILSNTIKSVLDQTYTDWEMIIVDDGSTDDTKSLVDSFNDKRLKYIYQEHNGVSSARNKAFEYMNGEWAVYIDSDNELLPYYLEELSKYIINNQGVLYLLTKGNRTLELYKDNKLIELIDDSKDFPDHLTVEDIGVRNIHFDINGFAHSRKIIDDGIRFDEEMDSLEDWDFVLSICEKYPDNFMYLSKVLFNYHQRFGGDGLVSNASYGKWSGSFERIYQKHKKDRALKNQKWYPDRVDKYRKLEEAYQRGETVPNYLRYFTKQN